MRQRQTKCLMAKNRKTVRAMRRTVLVLAVAVLALTFSVYAWFQASVISKGNSITAGNYAIVVAVAANGREAGSPTRIDAESSYTLTAKSSETYTVTLQKNGSVSTGYCRIESGGQSWYAIPDSDSFQFAIYPSDPAATYTFTAYWGVPDSTAGTQILAGESIGTPPDPSELPAEESPDTDSGQTPDSSTPADGSQDGGDIQVPGGSVPQQPGDVQQPSEGNGSQEVPPVEDDAGEKIPSSDGDTSAPDGEAANPDVVTGDTSPAQAGADSPAQDGGSGRTDSAAEGSALSD